MAKVVCLLPHISSNWYIFELPYFKEDFKLNRVRPEMIGCVITEKGQVTHVGTSQNHPRVSVNKKTVVEGYQLRRQLFLGPDIWSYDSSIQRNINAGPADPTANLSPEHTKTRTDLAGHHWVVFRGHPTLNASHPPKHYQPCCYA